MTMSDINGVTGAAGGYVSSAAIGYSGLSPDALLTYCQSQLGSLDDEIKSDIKQQKTELDERHAAEQALSAMEQYGDNGPTKPEEMQKCVDAINQAIQSLPADDPVRAKLQADLQQVTSKYTFNSGSPAVPLTPEQQNELGIATVNLGAAAADGVPPNPSDTDTYNTLTKLQNGSPPTWDHAPANGEWKGLTATFSQDVDDIKSNAEIQMLQLQDLVSQRQQAVSLATGMMSKEDQSLEQLARLGQG
jgi:hypothetical protein